MSQTRLEMRVGVFVLVGLVLLAVLLLLFSQGVTLWGSSFQVRLRSGNVGGIKPGANVLLAGVPVGRVSGVELDPDGKAVTIFLKISKRYRLYQDAKFDIEQAGFLGDQYISIYPGANVGEPLTNNAVVQCRNPFNLQETVATAAETISRIGQVTTNVNAAVADVRRHLLTEQKLSSLGASMDRFAQLTLDAQNAVSNVNGLVSANALPVTQAVSNLSGFSSQLAPLGTNLNDWVAANEDKIEVILENVEHASTLLTNLLAGLEAGRGAAGRLLRDEQLAANLSAVAENLAVTTSNLNRRGLWGILWKPKESRTNAPRAEGLRAPRDPFLD
jgi:phospholipid/cholesterol/gamma-HCH transport system substrate-binding protein